MAQTDLPRLLWSYHYQQRLYQIQCELDRSIILCTSNNKAQEELSEQCRNFQTFIVFLVTPPPTIDHHVPHQQWPILAKHGKHDNRSPPSSFISAVCAYSPLIPWCNTKVWQDLPFCKVSQIILGTCCFLYLRCIPVCIWSRALSYSGHSMDHMPK